MKQSHTKLTKAQKKSWNQNGFLFLPAIMPPADIQKFRSALDNLYERKLKKVLNKKFFIGFDQKFVVNEDDVFLELIDYKQTFEYILDIMGPCIQLCLSHALIRPAKNEFDGFMHVDGCLSRQNSDCPRKLI